MSSKGEGARAAGRSDREQEGAKTRSGMVRLGVGLRRELADFGRAGLSFYRHAGFDRAAALAFFGLLAFIPFLVLLLGIFGLVFDLSGGSGARPALIAEIATALRKAFPGLEATDYLTRIVGESRTLSLAAIPLFLLTTSAVYGTLESGVGAIFHPERTRSIARSKLLAVAFVSVLLVVCVAGAVAVVHLADFTGEKVPLLSKLLDEPYLALPLEVLVLAGVFTVLVRWFSLERVPYRLLFSGGLLFGGLWIVARLLFAIYLDTIAPYGPVYGSLTTVVVVLIWAYYSGVIFLYSAERVRFWYRR